MSKRSVEIAGLVLLALFASSAWGGTLIYDRGLPGANINSAAGANRSNVSWGNPGNVNFPGDGFVLGPTDYRIDTIRIWTVDGAGPDFDFLSTYNSVSLYGGAANSSLGLLQTGDFTGGTATNNPNIAITPVSYADGSVLYEGNAGSYQVWQVDFNNLNWLIAPGATMWFGVEGITQDPNWYWVNHASNAALSGSTQQGADGKYMTFDLSNLAGAPVIQDSNGNGFDKSSDINLQVFGEQVPEPGTWMLLGTALAAVAFLRRRRVA